MRHLGDFLVGELLELAQHQGLAQLDRQGRDHPMDPVALARLDQAGLGIVIARWQAGDDILRFVRRIAQRHQLDAAIEAHRGIGGVAHDL